MSSRLLRVLAGLSVAGAVHAAVNVALLRRPPADPPPVRRPVTVVLPVRNEVDQVGDCLAAVLGYSYLKSHPFKQPLQQNRILSLILNDEYAVGGLPRLEPHHLLDVCRLGGDHVGGFSDLNRQFYMEARAPSQRALDLNGSAQQLHEVPADAETQARTLSGFDICRLKERIEYVSLVLRSNTDSGVLHIDRQHDFAGAVCRLSI